MSSEQDASTVDQADDTTFKALVCNEIMKSSYNPASPIYTQLHLFYHVCCRV